MWLIVWKILLLCPEIKYEPTLCCVNADGLVHVYDVTAFVSIILGEVATLSRVKTILTNVGITVG